MICLSEGLFVDARIESLGVRHGTTTRQFGDMGDPARRRAFFGTMGFKDEPGLWLKQVHGDRVVRWPQDAVPSGERKTAGASGDLASHGQGDRAPMRADGWIAASPSRPLCVYTADCAPLFIWDEGLCFGGVFHVGWRGAAAGLPKAAVKALSGAFGAKPSGLHASVGPHIRPCCFRVGQEVSSLFRRGSVVSWREAGGCESGHLDLGGEIASQLAEAGLDRAAVGVCRECTCCRSDLFFSYRRDQTRESLMSFLALGA